MRMFNADGSEGLMCGNASRCIGKYVHDKGLSDKLELSLDTLSGIRRLTLVPGQDGTVERVTVDMGEYRIVNPSLKIQAGGLSFEGISVDVGNPHFVLFVPDASAVDPSKYGPLIELNSAFPDRTNVEFVSLDAPGRMRMRVWERGSGVTLACGTGACASAAAASQVYGGKRYQVVCDGGTLEVEVDGELRLSGPARTAFEGTIEI